MENQEGNSVVHNELQNKTIGDWLIIFLLSAIPLVNLILLIIWANDKQDPIRKNWAAATLTMAGIVLCIYIFIVLVVVAAS